MFFFSRRATLKQRTLIDSALRREGLTPVQETLPADIFVVGYPKSGNTWFQIMLAVNRTIKDATVKRFHYEAHDQLRRHLADFVDAYNFARRLKSLKALTPYEAICKAWTNDAKRFILNPLHQILGLNT